MTTILEANPSGTDELADWIELYVLKSGSKGISTQKLASEVYGQLGIEENRFALATNSLKKRAALVNNYPFVIDDVAIVLKEHFENSAYLLLLLLSRPSVLMNWQSTSPTAIEIEAFESLVCTAICNYLGPSTEGLPFGWPSKYGRPENFNEAIVWLAEKIGLQTGSMYRPPRRKDGGVDIVVWRKFPDNRSGFQICLVQCTLQQNYVAKSRDIDLRLWSGWLDMDRDPVTILAIPNAVPGDQQWQEATANSIVFERLRLSQNYESNLTEELKKVSLRLMNSLRTHE